MARDTKFEIRYELESALGNKVEKMLRVTGTDKKNEILKKIEAVGYRLISCNKLYPFSLNREAHNIELAYNAHKNMCSAMEDHELPWDNSVYEAVDEIRDLMDWVYGSYDPILWVPGDVYGKLHKWSVWAQCYRDDRNVEWKRIRDAQEA